MNYIVKPKIIGAVWKVFCCIMKYECCGYIELITLKWMWETWETRVHKCCTWNSNFWKVRGTENRLIPKEGILWLIYLKLFLNLKYNSTKCYLEILISLVFVCIIWILIVWSEFGLCNMNFGYITWNLGM